MTVYVFKTSVINQSHVNGLRSEFNQLAHKNEQWNFDLEDCDNILRIESNKPDKFLKVLQRQGYQCEEL